MVEAIGHVLASSLDNLGEAPGLELLTNASHSSSSDEQDLVSAAQRSPEAFARIYERHVDAVYRYLRLRVGSDAEDLTQQVFLRALAALPRYQSRGLPFAAWLFRIARNVAADQSRLRRRTPNALLPTVAAADSSPEESAMQRTALEDLRARVATLSLAKRELLAMRFGAGLSSREIGLVTGKSEAATKKQLARILHRIREECDA